jgi:hypothetical protein
MLAFSPTTASKAEGERIELSRPFGSPVFETGAVANLLVLPRAETVRIELTRLALGCSQDSCHRQLACVSLSGKGESRTRKAFARPLSKRVPSPVGLPFRIQLLG